MQVLIEPLLSVQQSQMWLEQLRQAVESWRPGEETAGWHARQVKHNHQLDRGSKLHQDLAAQLEEQLLGHPLLQASAFPRRLHSVLFSRSGVGEGYGRHEEAFRLPAGHAIVYPSTLLHRVESVTKGERHVAVGWIESRIRTSDQRELLFELDTARRALFARSGKDEIFDLISRSYSNLLRRWDS